MNAVEQTFLDRYLSSAREYARVVIRYRHGKATMEEMERACTHRQDAQYICTAALHAYWLRHMEESYRLNGALKEEGPQVITAEQWKDAELDASERVEIVAQEKEYLR